MNVTREGSRTLLHLVCLWRCCLSLIDSYRKTQVELLDPTTDTSSSHSRIEYWGYQSLDSPDGEVVMKRVSGHRGRASKRRITQSGDWRKEDTMPLVKSAEEESITTQSAYGTVNKDINVWSYNCRFIAICRLAIRNWNLFVLLAYFCISFCHSLWNVIIMCVDVRCCVYYKSCCEGYSHFYVWNMFLHMSCYFLPIHSLHTCTNAYYYHKQQQTGTCIARDKNFTYIHEQEYCQTL